MFGGFAVGKSKARVQSSLGFVDSVLRALMESKIISGFVKAALPGQERLFFVDKGT